MKFDFSFEALENQTELLEKISEDLAYLNKQAATNKAMRVMGRILPHMGAALGAAAITGSIGYLAAKRKYESHQDNLNKSFITLLGTHKNFSDDPEQFHQRFSELALISPTVASNPRLAQKILQPRMGKGFDLDDVHRLAAIEYHSLHSPQVEEPTAAAKTRALMAFGDWAKTVYPQVVGEVRDVFRTEGLSTEQQKQMDARLKAHDERQKIRDETMVGVKEQIVAMEQDPAKKKSMDAIRAAMAGRLNMTKKSSEDLDLLVSEESLGRMLAERHCLYKTATPKQGIIRQAWFTGGKALGDYFKVMALPLAIGGGIKLVSDLMKQRETSKMRQDADRIFAGLKRTNEHVHDNPELAQEAFDTLRSFAPSLAAKPIIARTFVEHVVKSNGMLPPDTANTLAKTEQLIQQLNDTTGGGFIEGLKNPMSIFKHTISKGVSKGKKSDDED